MSTKKNHHYIPKFYLRHFASTENKRQIGLYNYDNDIFINAASIKDQACEKFLYGEDDELENALAVLEGYTADILEKTIQYLMQPPEQNRAYKILLECVLYQMFRTNKAGKECNEMISSGVKEVFKHTSIYKEKYQGQNIEFLHPEPAHLSLLLSNEALPLMKYLSCKLIVNATNQPFVTSDNPVVKYNQFLEAKGLDHGTTGLAVKGLQLFFPIHPFLMLIFYDPIVYKLKERSSFRIVVDNKNDINLINGLQYINCDSQVFFGEGIAKDYLKTFSDKFGKVKAENKHVTTSFKSGNVYDGQESYYMFSTEKDAQINLNLSFIKLTKAAKQFELDDRLVYLRHESFKQWNKKKRDLVR
jgi:hypothetical protein